MTTSTSQSSSSSGLDQTIDLGSLRCRIRSTAAADGDFAIASDPEQLTVNRRAINDAPWTWLRLVHGASVVSVAEPGQWAGTDADGATTAITGAPLAVTTADCAPLVLVAEAAVAVLHVGWRGAEAGIVEVAAEQLAAAGQAPVASVLGPCIGVDAYEFGSEDLDRMVVRYGASVRGTTIEGAPALDMFEVVSKACQASGWPVPGQPACTSDPAYFSHRTRCDSGRQTTVAWLERP